ncbi:MAG: hypothetical protein ACK4MQ_05530 [Hyphomonas sp.]
MARRAGVLEFRRPKRRYVAVRRRPSKFRPAGRAVPARSVGIVPPALRMWMAITMLGPLLAWCAMTILR